MMTGDICGVFYMDIGVSKDFWKGQKNQGGLGSTSYIGPGS